MFFCCIDACSARQISLVLTVRGQDLVPRFLEGRQYSRRTAVGRLLAQVEEWQGFYRADISVVVCASSDGLPLDWLEPLQARFGVSWILQSQLQELVSAWQSMIPGQRWLRGTLMALLHAVPTPWYTPHEGFARLHTWLASHLTELDGYGWSEDDEACEIPV